MSNAGDWSRSPAPRSGPQQGTIVTALLAVIIVALLAAGVAGAAVHHQSTAAAARGTPAGFQRLIDQNDHMTVAVPAAWRVSTPTAGALSNSMEALKAADPQLTPVADFAIAALRKIQIGVFAIDATTRTVFFTYGVDAPGIRRLNQIPLAEVVGPLQVLGAQNVQAKQVHLPLGDAEQISDQLTIATVTVSELLVYFVLPDRVVEIVVAARGAQAPLSLLHQIEGTLTRI